jgi:hypothetical protein
MGGAIRRATVATFLHSGMFISIHMMAPPGTAVLPFQQKKGRRCPIRDTDLDGRS